MNLLKYMLRDDVYYTSQPLTVEIEWWSIASDVV